MRKGIIFLALLVALLLCSGNIVEAAGSSSHYYVTGKVTSISHSEITVAGVRCNLARKVRVIVREKTGDSIYERTATLSAVSSGHDATVRVNGNVVDEIIIERWTR